MKTQNVNLPKKISLKHVRLVICWPIKSLRNFQNNVNVRDLSEMITPFSYNKVVGGTVIWVIRILFLSIIINFLECLKSEVKVDSYPQISQNQNDSLS